MAFSKFVMNDSTFNELLEGVEWVSFDVFDTLICRAVDLPEDVFSLVAMRTGVESCDFLKHRKRVEARLRDSLAESAVSEITFDEIYEAYAKLTGADAALVGSIRDFELKTEMDVVRPNPYVRGLYEAAVASGKRIAFVSDMYLPRAFLADMLSHAGYQCDLLLVSSSERVTKSCRGELFERLMSLVDVSPERILHVGDNFNSDIKNAKVLGLKTYFVLQNRDRFPLYRHTHFKSRDASDSYEAARRGLAVIFEAELAAAGSLDRSEIFWANFGYSVAGPIIHAFAQVLSEQPGIKSSRRVSFLARDGLPVLRAMLGLYEGDASFGLPDRTWLEKPASEWKRDVEALRAALSHIPDHPRYEYLLASRRALNIASITRLDEATLNFLCSGPKGAPAGQFFTRIDLPEPLVRDALAKLGLEMETPICSLEEYSALRAGFRLLESEILALAATERTAYLRYLSEKNLIDSGDIALVDIGWHGSLQKSLSKLLGLSGNPKTVRGYYFGTFEAASHVDSEETPIHGFYFENGLPAAHELMVKQSVELTELMFLNTAPSFSRMVLDGNQCRAEFSNSICPFEDSFQGDLLSLGILRYLADIRRHAPYVRPDRRQVTRIFKELMLFPSREALAEFAKLRFSDGFGESRARALLPLSPPWYRVDLFERNYRSTHWRSAYLESASRWERNWLAILCPASRRLRRAYLTLKRSC